jgi:myo-inositol-1(or 4)-monophosphatase
MKHPLLNIAVQAARMAGQVIMRHHNRVESLNISSKARNDFVSEVDQLAEHEIIRLIRKAHPDHAFLAEESGNSGQHDFQWVIDPLDGTTNFLYGFPHYAVSIALKVKGVVQQAVVYDPFKEELFTASQGGGAHLNNHRLRVSGRNGLEQALLGTGIPFRDTQQLDLYLETLRVLVPDTAGIRRAGSAALDLAYVAAGRLDGFWEFDLKPWDMAAGVLLIQEAGGFCGDLYGGQSHWQSGDILCGSPKVFEAMKKRLQKVLPSRA